MSIVKWQPGRGWFTDACRTVAWVVGGVADAILEVARSAWRPLFGLALVAAVVVFFIILPLRTRQWPGAGSFRDLLLLGATYVVTRHREVMGDKR